MTILPRSLRLLLWLRAKAKVRLIVKRMRRPKSAFFTLAGSALTFMYLIPAFIAGITSSNPQPEIVATYFPVAALMMLIT